MWSSFAQLLTSTGAQQSCSFYAAGDFFFAKIVKVQLWLLLVVYYNNNKYYYVIDKSSEDFVHFDMNTFNPIHIENRYSTRKIFPMVFQKFLITQKQNVLSC